MERHSQKINILERDITDIKILQADIRSMNDTLVILTTELKHANEHLIQHEKRIDEIESLPGQRMRQIVTAIIAALSGGLISMVFNIMYS